MSKLRIEICNERLLPRFGVDRLLVLLGRSLAEEGHTVSFVALRCDHNMLTPITHDITLLPVAPGLDMASTEIEVCAAMAQRWRTIRPDAIVIGGWPFFSAAAQAGEFSVASLFIDAGAVAQDHLPDSLALGQREVRRIRKLTLPRINRILPISRFISDTQSILDRGNDRGVRTVLLGGDHMQLEIWQRSDDTSTDVLGHLAALHEQGLKLLLLLGRYEEQGYKNSSQAFELLRLIRRQINQVHLVLLDDRANCTIPSDLTPYVESLGTPDDHITQAIMLHSAAGLSTSLWEGFNLPMAEMQWLNRPVVAFNVGAHPEVIVHPWLLCDTMEEMASKLVSLLKGTGPLDLEPWFSAFQRRFRWSETLKAWKDEITLAVSSIHQDLSSEVVRRRLVVVDVTNASQDPANSGVIRVVRRLCAELQKNTQLELVFVCWDMDSNGYCFLNQAGRTFLRSYSGPNDTMGMFQDHALHRSLSEILTSLRVLRSREPVLFLPEVILDHRTGDRVSWAETHGFKTAALLYDLIPLQYPELCANAVAAAFPPYIEALSRVSSIWSISEVTRSAFLSLSTAPSVAARIKAISLPGQLAGESRRILPPEQLNNSEVRILCVSTLEPRKNHLRLLRAFHMLRTEQPDISMRLVLVGNRYAGAPDIVEQVLSAHARDNRIEWHGVVEDARLVAEFESATFTVYPSLVEGFGLPILESLWMGKPCLTHKDGVMRELARSGGCIMVDMTSTHAIKEGLAALATDRELVLRLSRQAVSRRILGWPEYSLQMAEELWNI